MSPSESNISPSLFSITASVGTIPSSWMYLQYISWLAILLQVGWKIKPAKFKDLRQDIFINVFWKFESNILFNWYFKLLDCNWQSSQYRYLTISHTRIYFNQKNFFHFIPETAKVNAKLDVSIVQPRLVTGSNAVLAVDFVIHQGPDFQKNLRKNPKYSVSFS